MKKLSKAEIRNRKIPLHPPFSKGDFPLYQEGQGCVPSLEKRGKGRFFTILTP